MNNKTSVNILLIILIPLISFTFIFIVFSVLPICAIKRKCKKLTSELEDPNQQPTYEEITQDHIKISMEGNTAYAHVTHDTEP